MEAETQAQIAGVRKWYNLIAENFSQRYAGLGGVFWKCFEEDLALELLGCPWRRILDLGCGPGRLASSLAGIAEEVVGIDVSEAMIEIAQAAPHPSNVRYLLGDARATTFETGSFDAVISLGMFEYLSDPTPFLHEIFRVLEPGGRFAFTVHSRSGEGFQRWWTRPRRLMGRIQRALFPRPASLEGKTDYGQPAALRRQLWSEAWHSPKAVQQILERQSFCRVDYRGFLFAPSVDVFDLASRLPVRSLSQAGVALACRLDHWLGKSHLTRKLSIAMMFIAYKPE